MGATGTTEIELHIMVDDQGQFVTSEDPDTLGETWAEKISSDVPNCSRVITVRLTVPLPRPVVLTGTVPAERGDGATLTVLEG